MMTVPSAPTNGFNVPKMASRTVSSPANRAALTITPADEMARHAISLSG